MEALSVFRRDFQPASADMIRTQEIAANLLITADHHAVVHTRGIQAAAVSPIAVPIHTDLILTTVITHILFYSQLSIRLRNSTIISSTSRIITRNLTTSRSPIIMSSRPGSSRCIIGIIECLALSDPSKKLQFLVLFPS